jgi:hypothetical protein
MLPEYRMYLRFETTEVDTRTGKNVGLFTLAYSLLREEKLSADEALIVEELLKWFKSNLPVPTKFTKKKNSNHNTNTPGISWLKSEEKEMVSKFWELKNILDEAGHHIEFIKVEYPGKIIYEDQFQVVAV